MSLPNEPGADAFTHEIGALRLDLEAFEGVTIDADNAPALRDVMARATDLAKRIETARKATKQPHLDAGKAVDAEFKPFMSDVTGIKTSASSLLTPFLQAEQERQRREAEEARKQAEAEAEDTLLADRAATKERTAFEGAKVGSASGLARAASLRTHRFARVTDAAALVAHYAGHWAVIEAAEKAANGDIRAAKGRPLTIPGVEIFEEQKAI